MRIAIIGAGNMGGAIACGLAQSHLTETREIIVANPHNEKLRKLQARFPDIRVTNDNKEAVRGADIVIVAAGKMETIGAEYFAPGQVVVTWASTGTRPRASSAAT